MKIVYHDWDRAVKRSDDIWVRLEV